MAKLIGLDIMVNQAVLHTHTDAVKRQDQIAIYCSLIFHYTTYIIQYTKNSNSIIYYALIGLNIMINQAVLHTHTNAVKREDLIAIYCSLIFHYTTYIIQCTKNSN